MKNITKEELKVIIDRHQHWINEDIEDWENMRANLFEVNLSGVNLYGVNLSGADLSRADLYEVNLSGANLSGANLSRANLYEVNLSRANLSRANLSGANLSRANLSRANLSRANLFRTGRHMPMACPDSGSFIGWKKCINQDEEVIVKLLIPDDSKRSSSTGRKCRCSKAKVLEFQNYDGNVLDILEVRSHHNSNFIYRIGETIEINDFDENRWNECSSGIHFFINRQEAVEYIFN